MIQKPLLGNRIGVDTCVAESEEDIESECPNNDGAENNESSPGSVGGFHQYQKLRVSETAAAADLTQQTKPAAQWPPLNRFAARRNEAEANTPVPAPSFLTFGSLLVFAIPSNRPHVQAWSTIKKGN